MASVSGEEGKLALSILQNVVTLHLGKRILSSFLRHGPAKQYFHQALFPLLSAGPITALQNVGLYVCALNEKVLPT